MITPWKTKQSCFFHLEDSMKELQCMKNIFSRKKKGIFFTDALKEPPQLERLPSVCKLDLVILLIKTWMHLELLPEFQSRGKILAKKNMYYMHSDNTRSLCTEEFHCAMPCMKIRLKRYSMFQ